MKKEELIQLHNFLLQLKTHVETIKNKNESSECSCYEIMGIAPYEIYKSKKEHTRAIFELSKDISYLMNDNYDKDCIFQKIYDRLEEICNRYIK